MPSSELTGALRTTHVEPLFKWAGGKRWLVERYPNLQPASFNSYFEPFAGSAAVFFHLNPSVSVLNDKNRRLIEACYTVRDHPETVYRAMNVLHSLHKKELYYKIREKKLRSCVLAACQFIYLNRVCWNGLYRENRAGRFNVPIGTKTAVAFDRNYLENVSLRLGKAELSHNDFERTIDAAAANDFIFIDPPYVAPGPQTTFAKYNASVFGWDDQIRLYNAIDRADKRGAHFLLTNADHPQIAELYARFPFVSSISRTGVLAGKSVARRTTSELIVGNYRWNKIG